METTVQIHIASTMFLCTTDAYERLSSYLERLRRHFEHETERDEIMRDIESRIAEKLLEQKRPLVTQDNVATVIAEIGEATELDDDAPRESETPSGRRLYRDTDTALIAGVASGIAAYFNISALVVRLIFAFSVFFGGTGFVVYLILWLVVPEAKTAAQKLEMHGKAVTFETIRSAVKTRIAEDIEHGTARRLSESVRTIVQNIFRLIAKVAGVFATVGAFMGLLALTIFGGIVLTNWNAPYNDIPFREVSSQLLLAILFIAGYVAIAIPLIFIFVLGYRLLRERNIIPTAVGFGLIGAWSLALVFVGVSGVKIAGDYYTYTETNPAFAVATETRELEAFEHLIVDGARIDVRHGDTFSATIEGTSRDIASAVFAAEDGTLTVRTVEPTTEACIFCDHSSPTIVLMVPSVASIAVKNGSVSFEDFTAGDLAITLDQGAVYGSVAVDRLTLSAEDSTVRADLLVRELSILADDASLSLEGTVDIASLTLQHSLLYADTLTIQDATITLDDSYAELDVRGNLEHTADTESELQNEAFQQSETGTTTSTQ